MSNIPQNLLGVGVTITLAGLTVTPGTGAYTIGSAVALTGTIERCSISRKNGLVDGSPMNSRQNQMVIESSSESASIDLFLYTGTNPIRPLVPSSVTGFDAVQLVESDGVTVMSQNLIFYVESYEETFERGVAKAHLDLVSAGVAPVTTF